VRVGRVFRGLIGVESAVVEGVDFDDAEQAVVVRARVPARARMSNALTESMNTKIRLLTRIAFGFRSAQALIALAMLALGGHRPALPGRA
jgi:Transposase